MGRAAAGNSLPGSMTPGADYWNSQLTPSALLGLSPASQSKAAGQALPPVGAIGNAAVPWHPDSPHFWLVVIAGATVLGLAGASFRVRAFKGRASAELGSA